MKCLLKRISAFVLIFPTVVFAGWQVAQPKTAVPNDPFFQAGRGGSISMASSYGKTAFPQRFATMGRPAEVYAMSISGSLKENLERIMDRYHWKVVWQVPYDYNFDGRITGSSLPDVIEKLLKPFPLQAVMYMSNRTMTVIPRKV